jgi:hypothetical protein
MTSDARHPQRASTAVVVADGYATTYRRWGAGRSVLLLGVPEAIAVALGDGFRVIVPEMPRHVSELGAGRWLAGVYDGLGIAAATIVTTPAWADAALQLRQDAPERVHAVLIVDASALDIAGLPAAVARSFR